MAIDITHRPAHQRNIGMMFQDEQLFPHLDVAANIAFGPRMHRWPAAEIAGRVDELLDLVGLDGFGNRRVDRLSGGEKKRIALARSLAPRPALLLLDEPLTGLDRELHDRLIAELADVLRATATTAVLVTHDRDEAATLATRVVERPPERSEYPSAGVDDEDRAVRLMGQPAGNRAGKLPALPVMLLLPTTIRSASTVSATAISTVAGSPTAGCSITRTPCRLPAS